VAGYGRAHGSAAEYTDDASVVRAAGIPVHTVAGDERAAKITVAHDLALAELQLGSPKTTGGRASQGAPATEERNEPGVEQL
jgi:2-C-methyl-D-erythritol 4-phosphate cytidylyltransferase